MPLLDLSFPPTAVPYAPTTLHQASKGGGCGALTASNVVAMGASGKGSADDAPALRAAQAKPGSLLYFPAGKYRLGSNLTLNKTVVMGAFTSFQIDAGVTLTLTQQPVRPPTRNDAMFTGTGRVLFSGPTRFELYPAWWKAASTATSAALQGAINSCGARTTCTVLQSQAVLVYEGGIRLNPRVSFYSTARANFRGVDGSGVGITLLSGSYSQAPMVFSGILGFKQFGLKLQPGVRDVNIQAGFVSMNKEGVVLEASPGTALRNVTISHISVVQSNQHSVVFAASGPLGSLYQDITVRINFDVIGGRTDKAAPSSGVLFRGGTPTLRNTRVVIQAIDPDQINQASQYVAVATNVPNPVANFQYRAEAWIGGFKPPGALLTGSFRDSLFYFFSSSSHWLGDVLRLSSGSSGNVINSGCVAAASVHLPLLSRFPSAPTFNSGTPPIETVLHVSASADTDWPPQEERTFFFSSHFARAVRPGIQMYCVPFRAWNPGLVCEDITRAPAAGTKLADDSSEPSDYMTVTLVNKSTKTIPAGFSHRFGVQIAP